MEAGSGVSEGGVWAQEARLRNCRSALNTTLLYPTLAEFLPHRIIIMHSIRARFSSATRGCIG